LPKRRKVSTEESTLMVQTAATRHTAATRQTQLPANTWDGRYRKEKTSETAVEAPTTDSAYVTESPALSEATLENQQDHAQLFENLPFNFPDLPDIEFSPATSSESPPTPQISLQSNVGDEFEGFGLFFNCGDDVDLYSMPQFLSPPLASAYSPSPKHHSKGTSQACFKNALRPTSFLNFQRALSEPTTETNDMLSSFSPVLPIMDDVNRFDGLDRFQEHSHRDLG